MAGARATPARGEDGRPRDRLDSNDARFTPTRGGATVRTNQSLRARGSPPRTGTTAEHRAHGERLLRFTPARGGRSGSNTARATGIGSPPGFGENRRVDGGRRSIPAVHPHARGEGSGGAAASASRELDHPRARGGHTSALSSRGSPQVYPRARGGRRSLLVDVEVLVGLTPAREEDGRLHWPCRCHTLVHPRAG
jgi:hypothetical protein